MKLPIITMLLTGSIITAQAQTGNTGIGTSSPGSKLTVNGSLAAQYAVVSASGNVGPNDYYLAYNGTTNGSLTLPAAISGPGNFLGRMYHFKNTGSATLTIAANGSELIDDQSGAGVASVTVPPGYYAFLISKGTTTGTTWELVLLASSNSVPAASTTYPFSAVPTTSRQNGTATVSGPWIVTEFNYPQGTVVNTGNVLNTTTGRFTAPTSGFYLFHGSTQFDNGQVAGTPAFSFVVLYLLKNGTQQLAQSYLGNPGVVVSTNVSSIVYLNAGETVSIGGAASLTNGGSTYQVITSKLYGYKIAN